MTIRSVLEKRQVQASVPCRIDFGGTLDLPAFYLSLNHLNPSTVNIALDMRTTVKLSLWNPGFVKISSKGFDPVEYPSDSIPFNHALGLMASIAAYFHADGVHMEIESTSPPRSALGGSSSASVAAIAAFYSALSKPIDPKGIVYLAHLLESSVAGVPCGMQDQLAAAYGGVHQWFWNVGNQGPVFTREKISVMKDDSDGLNQNIAVAYCGRPHVSKDINRQWVDRFLSGKDRKIWNDIARLTESFALALKNRDYVLAGKLMNAETQLRLEMTPMVLDETGMMLFTEAGKFNCGARFTGAGGGGCVWAIGESSTINGLKNEWRNLLRNKKEAAVLDTAIDPEGIKL